jgi:hypothetical protein
MLKRIILAHLILITLAAKGQVINSLSSDKTNIYFHALDSAAKILKMTESFNLVTVYGDRSITQNFPNIVNGIKLVKAHEYFKKNSKIKKGEARFVIKTIQIIRDEFKIPIQTWGHEGRLGDGLYIFRYQYIPETMSYKLKEIKIGIVL